MSDDSGIRTQLLARQAELSSRLKATQEIERKETAEGLNSTPQLREISEIRNGLDDEATAELNQVNEALARLEAGEYGLCESCGGPIGEARLESLPYATLCIDCAEASEAPEAFDPDEY